MDDPNQPKCKLASCSSLCSLKNETKMPDFERGCRLNRPRGFINNQMHHLRYGAYCDLAFWSNPAWLDLDPYSLSDIAVKQWVKHHRTWMAANKVTVAQIIGGVRGVIPNSRLARYGDYRYDIDHEDMYFVLDNIDVEFESTSMNVKCGSEINCVSIASNSGERNAAHPKKELDTTHIRNDTSNLPVSNQQMNKWLLKVRELLRAVRRVTYRTVLLDPWTDALMKICLRFTVAARINQSLIKLMDSEITFVTDYEQLQTEPFSEMELYSLPQPCVEEDCDLDYKKMDIYWLKLASPQIRNFWKKDTDIFDAEYAVKNQMYSLVLVNFIRRRKMKKRPTCSSKKINIPKNIAKRLLGSLLEVIEETPSEPNQETSSSKSKENPKNFFPEAHGEWTKGLFPHCKESYPFGHKIFAPSMPNAATQFAAKVDKTFPGNAGLPLRYYMSVPPPTIAPVMCKQPSYAHCQQQNRMLLMPANSKIGNQVSQQASFQIPTTPMTFMPPPMNASTHAASPNWSYSVPQLRNVPLQAAAAYQCPRMPPPVFVYQQQNPKGTADIQQNLLKKNAADFNLESSLLHNEEPKRMQDEKYPPQSIDRRIANPWVASPLVQSTNYGQPGLPIRFQQNVENPVRNCANMYTMGAYENIRQQIPPAIYNLKPNPHLHAHQTGLALKAQPVLNCQLPATVFQMAKYPRHPLLSQTTSVPPRFLGAPSINDFKLRQERFFMPMPRYGEVNDVFQHGVQKSAFIGNQNKNEGCLDYEDKVEKWLASINQYTKVVSNPKLGKECESFCSLEVPPSDETYRDEMSSKTKKKNLVYRKCQSAQLTQIFRSNFNWNKSSVNHAVDTLHEARKNFDEIMNDDNVDAVIKCRKYNVGKLHKLKLIFFPQSSLVKLKKGKYLEDKIKLLKHYFANFSTRREKIYRAKKYKPNLQKTERFSDKISQNHEMHEDDKLSRNVKSYERGKSSKQSFSSENYFDKILSNCFSAKSSRNYIMVTRESYEFNNFPSKRIKVYNCASAFFEIEPRRRKKETSINHFDAVADELFFSKENPKGSTSCQSQNESGHLEQKANGWTHFKVAVKTVLKNIENLLDKQNSQGTSEIKN